MIRITHFTGDGQGKVKAFEERGLSAASNKGASSMTVIQQVAICFTAGVIGALAVVLFGQIPVRPWGSAGNLA